MRAVIIFTDDAGSEVVVSTQETITIVEIEKARTPHPAFASTEELEAHLQSQYFWPVQRAEVVGDRRLYLLALPFWIGETHYRVLIRQESKRILYFLEADEVYGYGATFSSAGKLDSPEQQAAFVEHYNACVRPRSRIVIGDASYRAMEEPRALLAQLRGER